MTVDDGETLGSLGERRILKEVMATRYSSAYAFGDDSAVVPLLASLASIGKPELLVSTDPCPPPAAHIAGNEDEYYRGWLLATINLSDIAAAGGTPLGLVTSLVLPPAMGVGDLGRLLDGIDDCCASVGTKVIGGNLKEGTAIDVQATAIGVVDGAMRMSRSGARVGDTVAVVGDVGLFWAGLGTYLKGLPWPDDLSFELSRNLLTPEPKVAAASALAESGTVRACMDNSDGLYPTLAELGRLAGSAIEVDLDGVSYAEPVLWAAAQLGCPASALALGWGDWNLVVVVESERLAEATAAAERGGAALVPIGSVAEGDGVFLRTSSGLEAMLPVDSERFVADSWFQAGIAGYLEILLAGPSQRSAD